MSYSKTVPLFLFIITLAGCATTGAENVMSDLHYQETINTPSTKVAYLEVNNGENLQYIPSPNVSANNAVLGAVLARELHESMVRSNLKHYTYQYDQRQQAVFMQSLLDALKEQHAFKQVSAEKLQHPLKKDEILINIDFSQSRVGDASSGFPITLNVHATIQGTQHQACKRTHVIDSSPNKDLFHGKSFLQAQAEVSEKLLNQIIKDINQCTIIRS